MNLVISVVYLISIFVLTIIIYKYFGKGGLFIWISLNLIVCKFVCCRQCKEYRV